MCVRMLTCMYVCVWGPEGREGSGRVGHYEEGGGQPSEWFI